MEERASTRGDPSQGGSEREKSESFELQPAIEIESSALYYIRALGNYQQMTAAKRAARSSVVEMAFHFW